MDNPNYLSRLVGKEYKEGDNPDYFASTPPLGGLRVVVSHAATRRTVGRPRNKCMVSDVARAYFNAKFDRLL